MKGAAIIVFSIGLAACGRAPDPKRTNSPVYPAAPDAQQPTSPPPPPSDLAAPALTPEAEKGEKGARNVLLEWARALEGRDFARADAQWGEAAGEAHSAERYARYQTITVAFGNGEIEGAAGSLYYTVPVTVTGRSAGGATETLDGTIAVRRVNDVDGATPAQLRWHIASIVL
ncbi:MAG TPA: hypothetical protein VM055_04335 [Novosphingobium sp.]|nr:hypothetical protein [Novosphingobium sp.]